MRSVSSLLFCLCLCGVLVDGCTTAVTPSPASATQRYGCPMHPEILRDQAGDCPICGMRLVPLKEESKPPAATGPRTILFYRSPMDPKQTSPTPRKDEMGMDYVPVYADDAAVPAGEVPGRAVVTLDAARQQLIGLRTTRAAMGKVGGIWRTVGRVEAEPSQIHSVTVKIPGYIQHLFADSVGLEMHRGERLFAFYSADLLAAQEEYLLARRSRDALRDAGGNVANGDALVAASARKLALWDAPASDLRRLDEGGTADGIMTVLAPDDGLVTALMITEGAALQPGQPAFEITDLAEVWVMADAYQADLPKIQIGMGATYTVEALPGRTFTGEVAVIEASLDPVTRTARVHLHVPNPKTEIRPGMFGEVLFQGPAHDSLLIPADAVIPSGTRDMVFVALGGGRFEPRQVVLGERSRDPAPMVEVQSGLVDGDEVVTRANFLVDAESSLRASLAAVRGN